MRSPKSTWANSLKVRSRMFSFPKESARCKILSPSAGKRDVRRLFLTLGGFEVSDFVRPTADMAVCNRALRECVVGEEKSARKAARRSEGHEG